MINKPDIIDVYKTLSSTTECAFFFTYMQNIPQDRPYSSAYNLHRLFQKLEKKERLF